MVDLLIASVTEEDVGKRIDVFVFEKVEKVSRSYVQKLVAENRITVNGLNTKANYRLKLGDDVYVIEDDPRPVDIQPEDLNLDIVYEDDVLLIVNKPKGMVVHPASGNYEHTLVNGLLYYCKDSLSDINGVIRPGIVHRIDKDTSGLLLVAKTNEAHTYFSDLLYRHDIDRIYYAVAEGDFHNKAGKVDAPIGRHKTDRIKMAVDTRNGKKAVTHFEVLENFENHAFLKLQLETGRTHQIRVHMSYIGHPLVGDPVYGRRKQMFDYTEGQVLHAGVLGFVHPVTGEHMFFESKLPTYFERVLNELRCNNK